MVRVEEGVNHIGCGVDWSARACASCTASNISLTCWTMSDFVTKGDMGLKSVNQVLVDASHQGS